MAVNFKIIAQGNPSAATLSPLLTVGADLEVVVSSLIVCNRSATPTSFRVSLAPLGVGDSDEQYIYFDVNCPGNDSFAAKIGITLEATDVVRMYATLATLSFTLLGSIIGS